VAIKLCMRKSTPMTTTVAKALEMANRMTTAAPFAMGSCVCAGLHYSTTGSAAMAIS
jgi:hypothetical protein